MAGKDSEDFKLVVDKRVSDKETESGLQAPRDVIAQDVTAEDGEEVFNCYAVRRRTGQETSLELRFIDGNRFKLAYAYFKRAYFEPGKVEVRFVDCTVHIEGRNLLPVFEAVGDYNLAWVEERDEAYDLGDADTSFVSRIALEEIE